MRNFRKRQNNRTYANKQIHCIISLQSRWVQHRKQGHRIRRCHQPLLFRHQFCIVTFKSEESLSQYSNPFCEAQLFRYSQKQSPSHSMIFTLLRLLLQKINIDLHWNHRQGWDLRWRPDHRHSYAYPQLRRQYISLLLLFVIKLLPSVMLDEGS